MAREQYVGAIDQGTTGTRFVLFGRDGRAVESAYATHEQRYPRPGWVEHDPAELWANTKTVTTRALDAAGIGAGQLAALGLTNQRETTLLWDAETGAPLHDAIVWQDRRTTDRVEELDAAGKSGEIRATTGLQVDAYFSATKAEWLLDNAGESRGSDDTTGRDGTTRHDDTTGGGGTGGNDTEDGGTGGNDTENGDTGDDGPNALRERAERGDALLGTVDSWLLYNLTGAHATDVTNASRTMLYDIYRGQWDPNLRAEFGVPLACLPEVCPSSDPEAYGTTDPDGFLGSAVPVTGVLGDQQAALFGQACFAPGDAKSTYGTGAFVLQNTGIDAVESDHDLLTTIAFQRAGEPVQYALEGSIFATGAAIEWLVDAGVLDAADDAEPVARRVASTGGVFVVPAFAGLGAPHWDGRARGTILGLTRETRPEHVVRATLEAIAFRTRDVADAMAADSGVEPDELRVDGGAVGNDLLCELLADVLDCPVVRPAVAETTALGAAYAAGLAVGYWAGVDDCRANRRIDRRFEPAGDRAAIERRYARWGEAVERARGWASENGNERGRDERGWGTRE
jgi:glycerol kinase